MNKLVNFVKTHLVSSIAILVGGVALIVSGVAFIATSVGYSIYSKNYDKEKKVLLANTPQFPEEVCRDNEYVTYDDANGSVISTSSSYKGTYLLTARDAEIELDDGTLDFTTLSNTSWEVATGFRNGGSITYKINTASNGMSDIDVYLGLGEVKNIPIDNLIDFVSIKINGLPVTTVEFDLPSDGSLQQLVLKDTNLITGENKLEFATTVSSNNTFIMPAIAAVTFITDVPMA